MASRISATRTLHSLKPLSALLMVMCFSLNGISIAQAQAPTQAQGPASKASKKIQEPVTLNFNNADIDAVAKTLATLSGHNVVVDPRVKGTVTLTSTVPVAPSQALRLFCRTTAHARLLIGRVGWALFGSARGRCQTAKWWRLSGCRTCLQWANRDPNFSAEP
jgi:hypothetical protein